MRIGIVRGDLTGAGGAERYALSLIKKLADQGHEVHVFSSRVPETLPPTVVRHYFRQRKVVVKPPRLLRARAFQNWLQREQQAANLDLLFTLERTWPSDVFRAGDGLHREWMKIFLAEATPRKKWATYANGFHRATLKAETQLFRPENTRFVVCNSQMVADEIAATYPYPKERITVVPNGVDTSYFKPLPVEERARLREAAGIAPDELLMLFTGSGFWRKGLDIAVELVAGLVKHGNHKLKFWAAGKGDTRPLEKLAADLGVADKVTFLGSKAPGEVLPLYQMADLFLFPTRYDPFANVCLEANACGVPVITTRHNGFSEHVTPGRNGLVLEDGESRAAQAERIGQFCDTFKAASVEARAVDVCDAVSHLTLENHVETLLGVLNGLKPDPAFRNRS